MSNEERGSSQACDLKLFAETLKGDLLLMMGQKIEAVNKRLDRIVNEPIKRRASKQFSSNIQPTSSKLSYSKYEFRTLQQEMDHVTPKEIMTNTMTLVIKRNLWRKAGGRSCQEKSRRLK